MPRFFFDVQDGEFIQDEEGTELASLGEARVQAAKMAGAMLSDEAERFWTGEEWRITVRTDDGLILFALIFLAVNSAASPGVRAAIGSGVGNNPQS